VTNACPCGRREQPSADASHCYDCNRPLSPTTVRPIWRGPSTGTGGEPSPKAAEPNAVCETLATLFDAMFIEYRSKPKRVRMGYRLFADYRQRTGAHVAIGQSSFEHAEIRFVYDQELGPFGVGIEHG
jgi:hypothetical protein